MAPWELRFVWNGFLGESNENTFFLLWHCLDIPYRGCLLPRLGTCGIRFRAGFSGWCETQYTRFEPERPSYLILELALRLLICLSNQYLIVMSFKSTFSFRIWFDTYPLWALGVWPGTGISWDLWSLDCRGSSLASHCCTTGRLAPRLGVVPEIYTTSYMCCVYWYVRVRHFMIYHTSSISCVCWHNLTWKYWNKSNPDTTWKYKDLAYELHVFTQVS
jgi:hypothetical protein